MKPHRRKFLHLAAGAAALTITIIVALISHDAWSQSARTIKLVVPLPPGGGMDFLARLLSDQINRSKGPTIIVENRPGAGGIIGTEAVSRAAPDGSTVLITSAALIIAPHLRKLNYDPLTFEPICHLADTPMFIVVNGPSSYRTLADLVNEARAKPGELTLASVGPATTLHIASERFKRTTNVNMTYVPFPGTASAVNALLGGHVTAVFAEYPLVVEQVRAGKLRALATASRQRVEQLMDVPTVAETGYKDYEAAIWYGVVAPAMTPKETTMQLATWFTAALQAPESKPKLVAQGLFPVGACGIDFAAYILKQYDEYGRSIREASIKAE
jgi:tripartite-type tricarboxylate transporter receptor subunit TctC